MERKAIKIRMKYENTLGETYTMISLEFIEILGIELLSITTQALCASGSFMENQTIDLNCNSGSTDDLIMALDL